VLTYNDVPRGFNLASYFVDRNVEEGRGGRTALIGPGGATTYAELATLTNRSGNVLAELGVRAEERVLLVLADSAEFVALWYGTQKIGAVTAEAYTFLQPKDYAYYLDYTRASVVVADATTLERVREAAASSRWLRRMLVVGADVELQAGEASFDALAADAPNQLEPAPTTRDDIAIWKFTTGSTGLPKAAVHPAHSALLSFDWYARGVLDIQEDDVVLPVPKLFFGYARDLTALYPFGVGAAGIVFPERTTPERIFELVAQHRPSILVQVPTMMAAMTAHPEAARRDLSCLRLCTSAG
jgi:acyl-coenzyme A synthetase/AMP-(fatty) acid ligase